MRFLIDTNILLHAANSASSHHEASRRFLEEHLRLQTPWCTTWPILYEFARVATHPRVMRRPWSAAGAWAFVSALLGSPGLAVLTATERHADVAAQVIAELPWLAGNLIHDAHTAILMREHGIARICTRDADFRRFAFLEVVEPL